MDDFRSTQLCCSTVQMKYIYTVRRQQCIISHSGYDSATLDSYIPIDGIHVTRHDRRETGFYRPIRARMQLE